MSKKHLIKCYPCNILDTPEVINADGNPGTCQSFDNSFKNKGVDTYGKPFLVCKTVGMCGKQATYTPYGGDNIKMFSVFLGGTIFIVLLLYFLIYL